MMEGRIDPIYNHTHMHEDNSPCGLTNLSEATPKTIIICILYILGSGTAVAVGFYLYLRERERRRADGHGNNRQTLDRTSFDEEILQGVLPSRQNT
jgi:hypothetical protein